MKPTPINLAEAIFEPFWDPQLSGLAQWTVEPGPAHGLKVTQFWCWVNFEWTRRPASGPALRMWRQFDLDCTGYDHLLVSVMAPEGSILRVMATTDRGRVTYVAPPAPKLKKEHAIDLQGAGRIGTITLEIEAAENGAAAGWFNWLGLQNAALLPRYLAEWRRFDAAWAPYLQPESYTPSFRPTYGLLVNDEELDALRAAHLAAQGDSPFARAAREAERGLAPRWGMSARPAPPRPSGEEGAWGVPEELVTDFLNIGNDTRYNREREHGLVLVGQGARAAMAGILLKDPRLLRLAARYAMALAFCGRWDWGMISHFPGSSFEVRSFVQAYVLEDLALVLDLAGELFTPVGRDLLLRRIAEDGLGNINFNAWKHEYIHHCNQLPAFSAGRILGYALLERHWPRVRPYQELAYQDLVASLNDTILPDGGYVEGPSYFLYALGKGGEALYYHARSRGRKLADLLPERLQRSAAFAAALLSTDEEAEVIPICDAHAQANPGALAILAAALPQSPWVTLFRKALAREKALPPSLLTLNLAAQIPAQGPEPEPFVCLPEMGPIASTRKLGDAWVKLFIQGNKAGAGHTHEDKGSFVLEFAGQTFALDPGTCDYSSPFSIILKNCERHNMLVPTGLAERPHPQSPLLVDVKPRGEGDATRFHAEIDATPGWEGYYTKWVRTWDSPAPDQLTITDTYALAQGEGVAFYWQTQREVEVHGRTIILLGKRGRVVMEAPEECAVRVDELPLLGGAVQKRIAITKQGREGQISIAIKLERIDAAPQPV